MHQRVADVWLFVFYLSNGLVRVCEIEFSHMSKNNKNPDLVCEKIKSAKFQNDPAKIVGGVAFTRYPVSICFGRS